MVSCAAVLRLDTTNPHVSLKSLLFRVLHRRWVKALLVRASVKVLDSHLFEIHFDSLFTMGSIGVKSYRRVNIGLGLHDAIDPHLTAPRSLCRAQDMSLH